MRFKPGQSGNPGGRPKAALEVAKMIRAKTHNCADLVDYVIRIWKNPRSGPKSKQWAVEWLMDRAAGKAPQVIEFEGDNAALLIDVSTLSIEQLRELAAGGDGKDK